jgi:hypothetical protein
MTATNVVSFSDSALADGTTYYYRVRAVNGTLASPDSNVASATTVALPVAPAAPSNLVATPVSMSQIDLTWTDASNNETGFVIERSLDGVDGWTQVAAPAANTTSYNDGGLLAGTKYHYRVRALNGALASTNSAVASATTVALPPSVDLPAGWSKGDIGTVGKVGSSTYTGGKFTVSGAGTGIGGKADGFHFASQSMTGNGSIVAKVTPGAGGVAGIMLRDGSAANAKNVALVVNPNGTVSFSRRTSVGGATSTTTVAAVAGSQWLRLTRSGSLVIAYRSTNGTNWTMVGWTSISMKSTISAGLAVSSKSTASVYTTTIENVAVTKA